MIVLRNAVLIGIAAVAVSGCSSTGSGGSDDNSPPSLHGYNPTFYQDGTTLAQAREEGIEGLAVTADGDTTAKITNTGDRIHVSVSGKTYELPMTDHDSYLGYDVAEYIDDADPDASILTYDGQYSGFAALFNDGGIQPHTFVVTGQETENLPTQTATYEGDWFTDKGGLAGDFGATADFDAQRIDYTVETYNATGSGHADIVGSQFSGDIAFSGAATGSGSVSGALFGPQAEEIAGTSHGTVGGEDYQAVFHGRQE